MTYSKKIALKSGGFLGASYPVVPLIFHSSVFILQFFWMISRRMTLSGNI